MPVITSLVGAWELNEASGNAVDSHGSNTLTDQNTVGASGIARDFEADNAEYFSHASNSDLQTGDIDFSVEIWMRAESFTETNLISKDDDGAREFAIDLASSIPRIYIDGGTIVTSYGASLSTATDYQIIGWHDSVNNQLGIVVNDASPASQGTGGSAPTANASAFRIGTSQITGFVGYFDGLLWRARFWKKVLTTTERTWLYNSGSGRSYAAIVAESGGASTTDGKLIIAPVGFA